MPTSLRTDPAYSGFQHPRTIRIGSHMETHRHSAGRKKPVEKQVVVYHAISPRWLRVWPRRRLGPTA